MLDNDFESGSISPWMDESPGNVDWQIEKFSSPSETNSPVPPQSSGGSYLRATRNAYLSSGLAVFSTPNFTAYPGDKVSFDFWIRSKYPQGNSLEVLPNSFSFCVSIYNQLVESVIDYSRVKKSYVTLIIRFLIFSWFYFSASLANG